jgi:hypothetical protein
MLPKGGEKNLQQVYNKYTKEGTGQDVIKKFFRGFKNLHGFNTIQDSMNDVKVSTLKGDCNSKQLQYDFEGFENPVSEIIKNTVEMARQSWKWIHIRPILRPSAMKIFWHLKSRSRRYPSLRLKV